MYIISMIFIGWTEIGKIMRERINMCRPIPLDRFVWLNHNSTSTELSGLLFTHHAVHLSTFLQQTYAQRFDAAIDALESHIA